MLGPILFFALLAGGMFALQWWLREARRKRMAAWAASQGYTFSARDTALPHRFRRFEPFGHGHGRGAHHVVQGAVAGRRFAVFQYEYTTGSGKNREHHVHRICALSMPYAAPDLSIRREGLHHKLFDALGGEDIDFESDVFSRRFWVKCRNRRFAYDIIHPRMMEYLLPRAGYLWQWRGPELMLVDDGRIEPAAAQAMLQHATGFLQHLPRHLEAPVAA